MRNWKRVNQSPEVLSVVKRCGDQSVPRVNVEGREFRIALTPSGAEKLAERLTEAARSARSAHARHGRNELP